jgi:hypothetical protein
MWMTLRGQIRVWTPDGSTRVLKEEAAAFNSYLPIKIVILYC